MRAPLTAAAALLALAGALTASTPLRQQNWLETVIPPPEIPAQQFGHVVALDAETMAVSSYHDDVPTVWVISRTDGSATELVGQFTEDQFGSTLAVEGDFLAVGTLFEVAIYRRDGAGWTEVFDISVPNTFLLSSLALSNGRLAVGGTAFSGGGFVEVLRRTSADGSLWEMEAHITGPPSFGHDVGLWNDTLAVGSPPNLTPIGYVHVYERVVASGGLASWVETDVLDSAPVPPSASFGSAVDVRGERLLVGAPHIANANGRGAALVYRRQNGELAPWELEAVLEARPGDGFDGYAWTVAVGEDELFVGAHTTKVRTVPSAGAVYRYVRGAPGNPPWKTDARLVASDFHASARFGWSIATDGRDLLVGAPADLPEAGSAYLLEFPASHSTKIAR